LLIIESLLIVDCRFLIEASCAKPHQQSAISQSTTNHQSQITDQESETGTLELVDRASDGLPFLSADAVRPLSASTAARA
jgi:proline dehydrogenase